MHLANGYPAAVAKYESTICTKSRPLQFLHQCVMSKVSRFN
jgi:hypothetical protein